MDLLEILFAKVTDSFYLVPSMSGRHTTTIQLPNKLVSIVSFNKTIADSYLPAIRHLGVGPKPILQTDADDLMVLNDQDNLDELNVLNDLDGLDEQNDFTILLLDSESTEIEMPDVELLYRPREQTRKAFENEERTIIATIEGEKPALSIINFRKRIAVLWLPSAAQVPGYQLAAPFRTIFNWMLGESGFQLVHAAAVGYRKDGLLMSGLSGSGKTVTSLACLEAGWNFLGDDFVVIGPSTGNSGVSVYSLYNSARLHNDMTGKFNLPKPALTDDKSLYFLHPQYTDQLTREIPLHMILMPVTSGSTSPQRLSSTEVVREIMVPTLAYLPGRERTTFRNLTGLLADFPCHSVDLGGSTKTIPETLRRLALTSRV